MKVCVIGCGDIANAAHGPSLSRLREEGICETAACCASHLESALSFKERFGFNAAYTDYVKMLNEQRPDAVFIFLPVKIIASCAVDVMRRGYPIIMEKPPGVSVQETDMLVQTARETGLFNAVTFNRRSMPLLLAAKERLRGQKIDAVSLEMCRYMRTNEDFTTTAIHGIDCLRFMVDSDYREFSCTYQTDELRQNTNYLLTGTFQSGTAFTMSVMPDAGAVTERITVYTKGGQMYIDLPVWSGTEYTEGLDCPGRLVCVSRQAVEEVLDGQSLSGTRDGYVLNGFYDEDRLLLKALSEHRSSPLPIESGRQSVEISTALRNKAEKWEANK